MLRRFPWLWVAARKMRQLGMRLAGREPLCGQIECMTMRQHIRAVRELTSIRDKPKLVKVDGDLKLWQIKDKEWWAPPMPPNFLDKMADEIQMDIYGIGTLPAGSVVIDGGANVGMFAQAAMDAGAARVICFEPSPLTRAALSRNMANAPVTIRSEALWDEAGEAMFAMPLDDPGSAQVVQTAGVRGTQTSIQARLAALDQIVEELGLDRVDFIKLDIEGAETQALTGAVKTLSQYRPRVAIATEHTSDVLKNNRSVLGAMRSVGGYAARCMECHAERSESYGGIVLTPYVLQMCPNRPE